MCIWRLLKVQTLKFETSNLFFRLWIKCLSDCALLGIFEELFWMCFFWWLCCSFHVCIDKDVYVWMLPKFQTLISRQQTCFALCEVKSNPMTLVWIFLKSYFDCASFGGGLAHFRCVLVEMCGFENCISSKYWLQDNHLVLQFVRWVPIRLLCFGSCWKTVSIVLLLVVVLFDFNVYQLSYNS